MVARYVFSEVLAAPIDDGESEVLFHCPHKSGLFHGFGKSILKLFRDSVGCALGSGYRDEHGKRKVIAELLEDRGLRVFRGPLLPEQDEKPRLLRLENGVVEISCRKKDVPAQQGRLSLPSRPERNVRNLYVLPLGNLFHDDELHAVRPRRAIGQFLRISA